MKRGDLILDTTDGEIGLVVALGPGLVVQECEDYPDGIEPSWKVKWPSLHYVCDLGEELLTSGQVVIISEA